MDYFSECVFTAYEVLYCLVQWRVYRCACISFAKSNNKLSYSFRMVTSNSTYTPGVRFKSEWFRAVLNSGAPSFPLQCWRILLTTIEKRVKWSIMHNVLIINPVYKTELWLQPARNFSCKGIVIIKCNVTWELLSTIVLQILKNTDTDKDFRINTVAGIFVLFINSGLLHLSSNLCSALTGPAV